MADRQQNITVNYKFNTSDIERASAILSRANQASNTLQGSGQKAGQAISSGFNQARQSIAAMEIQLARLKTQIQVSSDPRRVAELSNQYKVLKTQIDAANKSAFETSKTMKAGATATQSLTQQFGGLFNAVRLFITAGIGKEVVETALAMASLSGRVEGVERAFQRAFPNNILLLRRLRESTQGAVTDFELMQRTLQAANLGVSAQELPVLFEFAAARAQQTGESVDYLVDSIVRGIGRKSPLILDNLGLSATRLKEQFDGAALASQSVADVTKAVSDIAREELTKMGGYVETTETQVKQLNVELEETKILLSQNLASGGFIQALREAVQGIGLLADANKRSGVEAAQNLGQQDALRVIEGEAFKQLGDNQQAKIDFIQQEMNSRLQLIGRYNDTIAALMEERKELQQTKPYDDRIEQLAKTIKAYDTNKFVLAATILALKGYREELEIVNEVEVEQTGIIERKKEEIKALQEQLEKTNDISDLGIGGRLVKALEIAQAELGDLQRAFSDIDPKPFEISIKTAENQLTSFGTNIKRIEDQLAEISFTLPEPPAQTVAQLDTFWTNMRDMWNENWKSLVSDSVDFQADAINNLLDSDLESMRSQISQLQNYYQQQQELAGDNERAASELRVREDQEVSRLQRRLFEREKAVRRSQAVIDGAAAAIKAFVTAPNVYVAIAQAALIAATTIAQLRIIDREQPRFAKGVINLNGPGTATSDSIPARLSRGESVMTAWETQHAGNVLKEIRAKKLDNRVLRDLRSDRQPVVNNYDDSKIIKAIEKNRAPDIVKESNIVYEVRQHSDTLRRKQRAKAMNI